MARAVTPAQVAQIAGLLARAPDAKLREIICFVEALPGRGALEPVIARIRPRLRALRPGRPLTFGRVLWLSVEPLLVDPARWRTGQGEIPRHALDPLAEAIRAADPALAVRVDAAVFGKHTDDALAILRAGEALWPGAAAALPAEPPAGWRPAGLPAATYGEIAAVLAPLLRHGVALHDLRLAGPDGPPEGLARPALQALAAEGPAAVSAGLACILPFASQPARIAALAVSVGGGPAAEAALDRFIEGASPQLDDTAGLSHAAAAAERFALMLTDLDRASSSDRPHRAKALHKIRKEAGASCRTQISAADMTFGTPLREALGTAAALDDREVEALEQNARALRSLVETAHALDGGGRSAQPLEAALATLRARAARPAGGAAGFTRADTVRLIEILGGPDAAEQAAGRPHAA